MLSFRSTPKYHDDDEGFYSYFLDEAEVNVDGYLEADILDYEMGSG